MRNAITLPPGTISATAKYVPSLCTELDGSASDFMFRSSIASLSSVAYLTRYIIDAELQVNPCERKLYSLAGNMSFSGDSKLTLSHSVTVTREISRVDVGSDR
jgi:hypothetical protein